MEHWKLDRIASIKNEVNELHPLLKQIFNEDATIGRVEYTHGTTEMGADFVLSRTDPTLSTETYVGVIAKCTDVRQDYSDIERQIKECLVKRFIEGGKKEIYISEI